MRNMLFALLCLTILASFPVKISAQEVSPSCDDQLMVAQSALFFTRASRNATEENAARVVMELQKQITTLRDQIAKSKASATVAPHASETEKSE